MVSPTFFLGVDLAFVFFSFLLGVDFGFFPFLSRPRTWQLTEVRPRGNWSSGCPPTGAMATWEEGSLVFLWCFPPFSSGTDVGFAPFS